MGFAQVKQAREQQVLFSERLDQAVDHDHDVRLVDKTLQSVDFSEWEARCDLTKGQPPIHARAVAGVIRHGLLCRISSCRALEEALLVRLDFRWLVEGRRIDHSSVVVARVVWGSCSATPTESRSDSTTSLNLPPISLSDSLELLDWMGRQLRRVREANQTNQTKRCVPWVTSDESSRWGLPPVTERRISVACRFRHGSSAGSSNSSFEERCRRCGVGELLRNSHRVAERLGYISEPAPSSLSDSLELLDWTGREPMLRRCVQAAEKSSMMTLSRSRQLL
jgi:hypothetical protein